MPRTSRPTRPDTAQRRPTWRAWISDRRGCWATRRRASRRCSNPFPVRATGTRFDEALGSSLGVNTAVGTRFQAQNPNRVHPRVQRWRASVQREISRNMAVEIAYNGSRGDRLDRTIRQDYLPEQYWNGSNVRDLTQQNLLNAQRDESVLDQQLRLTQDVESSALQPDGGELVLHEPHHSAESAAAPVPPHVERGWSRFPDPSTGREQSTFTRAQLQPPVREWLHHERLLYRHQVHERTGPSRNTIASRRSGRRVRNHGRTASRPTSSPSSRSAAPKPFLNEGGVLAAILSGWQVGGTYEWQPGALLEWPGNIFFYGDLDDIKLDNPTTDRWFNTDAGFEKDPAKVPANVPEAHVPVPHRRRACAGPQASEYEHRPDDSAARQQNAAAARRRAERLQQRDVRQART